VRLILYIAALLAAAPVVAADRNFSVTSFDRIRVEGPFAVTVTTGKAPSARASGTAESLERVQLRVEGRTLLIRPNMSAWGGFPGRQAAPAAIAVSTPDLHTAIVIGSGRVVVDRMRGARAVLTVEGAGRLSVRAMDVDTASLSVAGAGGIEATGRAKQVAAIARGVADIQAGELITPDLNLIAETAGSVTLHATRSANVTSSGVGPIEVLGTAACEVRKVGSGPLRCGR
jgi:predicted transcriptional regulator